MTINREKLVDRMIRIYGFENPLVIQFAEMCESWEDNDWNNTCLTTLVKAHEASPILNDEI